MKKLTVLALAVSAMTIAAFGMNASAATKLNLSVPDAASSSIGVAAQEFADQLNEKSGGELEVKVFFDGSLYGGDATAAVTTMQDGGLDMLCLATSWYASFDDSFNMINIPYLFKSVDAEQAYLNDEASKPMWDAVEGMGVKFLAAWTRSFRMTTNNIRPITKPEDFQGIKLRTPGNQIYQIFFGPGITGPATLKYRREDEMLSGVRSLVADLNDDFNFDEKTDQEDVDFMIEKGMEYNELDEEAFAAFQEVSKSLYPKFQEIVNNPDLWDATIAFAEAN